VGESSFWYWPTRVVPDQRPLNGRCCMPCEIWFLKWPPFSLLCFHLGVGMWKQSLMFSACFWQFLFKLLKVVLSALTAFFVNDFEFHSMTKQKFIYAFDMH